MKILSISDLHLDKNSIYLGVSIESLLDEFKCFVLDSNIDLIIMSGDLCWGMDKSLSILRKLEFDLGIKILYVPGNHDVMISSDKLNDFSSDDLLNLYLESEFNVFDSEYELKNGISVLGSFGWYDYSYFEDYKIDIGTSLDTIEDEVLGFINSGNAGKYINFSMSDKSLFNFYLNKTKNVISNTSSKEIYLMTHFVPFRDYLLINNTDYNLMLSHSILGSKHFGKWIESVPKISKVFYGHTHLNQCRVDLRNSKSYHCNSLGFLSQWVYADFRKSLLESSYFFEI